MDTEFHYYITGIIAHAAGFTQKDASVIAWSSEFTDENDQVIRVQNRSNDEIYENYISQTMNILKPKRKLMRIYPVFHFVPGEPDHTEARRRDGKMHLLNTTPNNGLACQLIDEALKNSSETRLYRIGIATHAYADTWAHQNFVGWYDFFNNIALDPKPDIGHADAEHHPDWVGHRWDDERLVDGEVNNIQRFLLAAEAIYNRYRSHLETQRTSANSTWNELQSDLFDIMGPNAFSGPHNYDNKTRLKSYKKLAPWLRNFDKDRWREEAMEGSFLELLTDNCWYAWREEVSFQNTNWYRFQEAIKEHQTMAMQNLKPTFSQMGVDLHIH
ncbi:MAG: hypothetical protein ACI8ZB_004174 [Desulforhopalus sp.]|jgi:hypothetical protein